MRYIAFQLSVVLIQAHYRFVRRTWPNPCVFASVFARSQSYRRGICSAKSMVQKTLQRHRWHGLWSLSWTGNGEPGRPCKTSLFSEPHWSSNSGWTRWRLLGQLSTKYARIYRVLLLWRGGIAIVAQWELCMNEQLMAIFHWTASVSNNKSLKIEILLPKDTRNAHEMLVHE